MYLKSKSYILLALVILAFKLSVAQVKNAYLQEHPVFEICEEKDDQMACFDSIISQRALEVSKDRLLEFHKKYPDKRTFDVYISFIIDEHGKPIPESFRNTKYKAYNLKEDLVNLILDLPKIKPARNINNHTLLSYYSLYLDLSLDSNNNLIIENQSRNNENSESDFTSPIYPGCKIAKNNKDLKACFSGKLQKTIGKKFNYYNAFKNFDKTGIFHSYILFEIDKEGEATNIAAFAPNEDIKRESLKALGKIKKLKPGTSKGNPVTVPYMLPIYMGLE